MAHEHQARVEILERRVQLITAANVPALVARAMGAGGYLDGGILCGRAPDYIRALVAIRQAELDSYQGRESLRFSGQGGISIPLTAIGRCTWFYNVIRFGTRVREEAGLQIEPKAPQAGEVLVWLEFPVNIIPPESARVTEGVDGPGPSS